MGQIVPSIHSFGRVSSSHIFFINLCILLFSPIPHRFISSAGIFSDPASLHVLSFSVT
jgi:hypothetical protein